MAFSVLRTDTGQFVVQDPRTDTVVIDDDLAAGFEKLETALAEQPADPAMTAVPSAGASGGSAFAFRGGSRYAIGLLAVVLPFVWLAVLYFALANLLAEAALGRSEQRALEERVEALESEVEALRAAGAAAPRVSKSKARRASTKGKPKPGAKGEDAETDAETAAAKGDAVKLEPVEVERSVRTPKGEVKREAPAVKADEPS